MIKKIVAAILHIFYIVSLLRFIPHLIIFYFHPNKWVIKLEINRWLSIMRQPKKTLQGFFFLMTNYPEFRNLFYFRIGFVAPLISFLCPKMNSLFINSTSVGPGLFIQHGFATIISAESVGKNCWINQQVTIGYSNATDCPTIGDNVIINAGAKVIGKVHIGNNSIVGANAVVVKDVPENCTVVGVPAYIIKKDGVKCKEAL